jgi:hypothetical protein
MNKKQNGCKSKKLYPKMFRLVENLGDEKKYFLFL